MAPPRAAPAQVIWAGAALATLVLLGTGCGDSPAPGLAVGEVGFSHDDTRGLGTGQLETLASMAALGLMVSEDAWERVGGPRLEAAERALLGERLREEVILEGAGVTEAQLEAVYTANPEWELEVRHLVVLAEPWEPAARRREARERAAAGLERIRGGEDFAAVVAEVSEEPGAAGRGGLLRPGRRGTWVGEFWEAALALEVGGVSGVVESPYGFHVLRLEDRSPLPLEEARPRVVREVARGLGGGAYWEETLEGWREGIEILPPEAAPRPRPAPFPAPSPLALPETSGEDPVLARWPGGSLTLEAFTRHLLALPARRLASLADEGAMEAELRVAAEVFLLAHRAREREIALSEPDQATLLRGWEREAGEWAGLLGFTPGLSAEGVAERALAGLRATGQNARIGREGAATAAPSLLAAYPLEGQALAFPSS